jgi:hypothetical protein
VNPITKSKVRIPLQYWYRPDWHLDKQEAIAQAEYMRGKAIQAIQRRLDRLNNLKFIL